MLLAGLTIRSRLLLAFGVLVALLVALAVTSTIQFNRLGSDVDDLAWSRVPKVMANAKSIEILLQSARQMRDVLILDDENQVKSEIADIYRNRDVVKGLLEQVEKTLDDDVERNLFKAIVDARARYLPHEEEFLKITGRGDLATAKDVMLERVRGAQAEYVEALRALIDFQGAESASEARASRTTRQNSLAAMLGFAGLAIALAIAEAILITRAISRPLGMALRAADAVASGNLTVKIEASSRDEMGLLLESLEKMRASLAAAVDTIRQSSQTVGDSSKQIAAGNVELASRTEEQASSLEETAASMEELTTTVQQNAENARQANQLALQASSVADAGGKVMGEVIATMGGISEASRKIADIIGVIDAIAFQTNILALNAAVEAARAGESGRGFAVVASEVRSLAQRSAASAKEIKELIRNSVERVDGGKKLIEGAGKTMEEIVVAVQRVNDIMAEIAAASREQLLGIEQVGGAVTQMDHMVQQNAAIVEEAAAAAESMATLGEQLIQAVARFRLDRDLERVGEQAGQPVKRVAGGQGQATAAAPAPPIGRRSPPAHSQVALVARAAAAPATRAHAALRPRAGDGERAWNTF